MLEQITIKKIGFYLVLGAVMAAEVLAMGLVLPGKWQEISQNNNELRSLSEETDQWEKAATTLETLDKTSLNRTAYLARAALPSEKKVQGLVSGLAALASGSGVVVDALEFRAGLVSTKAADIKIKDALTEIPDIDLKNGIKGIPVTMSIAGDEVKITDYLQHLQRALPLIGVTKFDYASDEKGKSALMQMLVYFQVPSQGKDLDPSKIVNLSPREEEVLAKLGPFSSMF